MEFDNYFGSLLKNTFSFVRTDSQEAADSQFFPDHRVTASEHISLNFGGEGASRHVLALAEDGGSLTTQGVANVIAVLKGEASSKVQLLDSINVRVITGAGNDFVNVRNASHEENVVAQEILLGDGNNFVSLSSVSAFWTKYNIISGNGNDRILSSGLSHDLIMSGKGKDMIMSGRGQDHIDGQEGWDSVLFEGVMADYKIERLDDQSVRVTHLSDDLSSAEIYNVEELVFADQSYILPFYQQVLLDSYEQLFDYLAVYYTYVSPVLNDSDSVSTYVVSYDTAVINSLDQDASVVVDDWNDEDDYVAYWTDRLTQYDEGRDFSGFDETPTLDADPNGYAELHDFILKSLPFDPLEVHKQLMAHDPLKLLGGLRDDVLIGDDKGDRLFGGDGNDILVGLKGNDFFVGDRGNDVFLGGEGIDTAFYLGMSRDFCFDIARGIMIDKNGEHGADYLKSIERLIFLDGVYKINSDMTIELLDDNPFELIGNYKRPELEIIGMPPKLPDMPEKTDMKPPTAQEIEEALMNAYQSVLDHHNKAPAPSPPVEV